MDVRHGSKAEKLGMSTMSGLPPKAELHPSYRATQFKISPTTLAYFDFEQAVPPAATLPRRREPR
jgi:hypothetical protein